MPFAREQGRWPLVIFGLVMLGVAACRHSCRGLGPPEAHFSIASCCGSEPRYYWDDAAKDCIELASLGEVNCGCICHGKDCDRLFWSQSECRRQYAHCR